MTHCCKIWVLHPEKWTCHSERGTRCGIHAL